MIPSTKTDRFVTTRGTEVWVTHTTLAGSVRQLVCIEPTPGPAPATPLCGKGLDCGGTCSRDLDHDGDHLCIGDEDGKPGSCPA